jgi:hypothetical protein
MSLNESTVTMKLGDYQKLDRDVQKYKSEAIRLAKELEDAKIDGGDDGLARQYLEAFMASMPIIRFAVGNMDPMSFRGWPYEDLETVIVALKTLPGIGGDQKETAGDLQLFARDCKEWEDARANGTEKIRLKEQNAARGPVVPPQ